MPLCHLMVPVLYSALRQRSSAAVRPGHERKDSRHNNIGFGSVPPTVCAMASEAHVVAGLGREHLPGPGMPVNATRLGDVSGQYAELRTRQNV